MIDELFYLDEGHVKIDAASVGISSRRWACIFEKEVQADNYKKVMTENRFDVLPIIPRQGSISEYFKTDIPNSYDKISRHTITYKDVLALDTSIRDVIKSFAIENRTFYFLTLHNRITGLITLGNLNCKQVQIYIFALVCEVERALGEFIGSNLSKEQLETFMREKSKTNDKTKKVWDHYQDLVRMDLENQVIEHLYLIDFFSIIEHYELNTTLNFSKKQWAELSSINELRHLVAHPTRSLLDKDNDIARLWKRIGRIEDVIFRLSQWKQSKQTENGLT